MLKNYLKIALRNLGKHKLFTSLNIFGLSVSMSVCLVLILLVYDHFQYDKFHANKDSIYRIITYTNGHQGPFDEGYATSPLGFKDILVDNYSFVKGGTNLNTYFRGEIRSPHKILETRSLYGDKDFLSLFGFELLEGDKNALDEPFSIILNEDMAGKLFPEQQALGQTIDFEDHGSYKVTGVVKDPPSKTHLQFDAMASISTLPFLNEKQLVRADFDSWENIWGNYNYILLDERASIPEVEKIINEIASTNQELEDDHPGYAFELQALTSIVPGKILGNEISFALPWFVLAFFGFLGLVVLITATINYTNLSIAKSLSRAKEIGIRKVNGASKRQIVSQFLVESVLTSCMSLVLAFIMYKYLVKAFNEIWIFNMAGVTLTDSIYAYGYFVLFAIVLGLLTGIGPSLFLSRLKAINSLKGKLRSVTSKKKSIFSYISGKRTLISIQFSLSILMLITILILHKQANFLVGANYGFNDSEIFFVTTYGQDEAALRSHFGSIPGVEDLAFTSHHPGVGRSNGFTAHWKEGQEPITLYHFAVDHNYIDVMGLELIAGTQFPENISDTNEKFIIINETALETYGFESSSQAIGEALHFDDRSLTISGVIKDYHWEPLMASIRPLALRIMPGNYEFAYLKVSGDDIINTKNKMEEAWIEFDKTRDFQGGFLNAEIDQFYQFFYDLGSILTYIALLALSITSLGFLGMVSFDLKTKIKEIGIRRVLGATFQSLIFSMSKGFVIMICITSLLAIPLALWINNLWVNAMAYHAPIGLSIIIPAAAIIFVIAGATIISQVWVNANRNPTETLRSE
ncbi:ABC transporter permease [Ekhidna sp.]|uniref:ABC transporter permease n=1 Tax=Ekhidna sp. TaxID=2608089 RepID=UPI003B50F1C2